MDFCGEVAAKRDHTCTILKDISVADKHAKLTVAGTVGAAGQCPHTVPARAEKGTRHWSDQGPVGDHPQRTGGGTALDKAQREVHTRAVLSDLAKLTATGRRGTVGPMQAPVQFLVAKE